MTCHSASGHMLLQPHKNLPLRAFWADFSGSNPDEGPPVKWSWCLPPNLSVTRFLVRILLLHQDSLDYTVRLCLRKQRQKNKKQKTIPNPKTIIKPPEYPKIKERDLQKHHLMTGEFPSLVGSNQTEKTSRIPRRSAVDVARENKGTGKSA